MNSFKFILGFILSSQLASSVLAEEVSMLTRLEKGEIVATKAGTSFTIQAVVKKKVADVREVLFKDFTQLPKFFKEVAFVQPYSSTGDVNLLYLKLRGLGDGLGVLMEVKSLETSDYMAKKSSLFSFANAESLIASSESLGLRKTESEVDLKLDSANQDLMKLADAEKKAKSKITREVSINTNLILEGPINPIPQFPTLRLVMNIAVGPYTVSEGGSEKESSTYLIAKVSFGNQAPQGELGDISGFGDMRLNIAKNVGKTFISSIKTRIENL
ncbi:MAG: hypothetical protein J0L93_06045 [Deltaproteobacteria bacterium]|nr:hypothetical protein [Deltaproteobacteria bacterium]